MATSVRRDMAPPAICTGMLVVDKHKSVRSFGVLMVINAFLGVMERLNRMPHPNVTRLMQSYSSPTHLYLCLHLAGPQTLFTRLSQRDTPTAGLPPHALPSAGMQSIAAQISAAICHLHIEADVCHRDIKPENVSVSEGEGGRMHVRLFGFELSVVQPKGETCKTMPFVAPEVILAGKQGHDGKAADMWSLGILLLEIACGLRSV
eukprot:CAMPEP_0176140202 /NCGR_PEP_ID=MMETSP0120_2-20121206/71259_1 /TAXON_ID=160619 /ORGANISM="Kryptoperidinium foliaceum, Strain CCMP 1326" /LENGTH=204 /DNA_ID=CAMNT_0017476251 /DNA_START=68 /DNA_END=679 /DNA_ORIENTATION=+